MLSLFSHESGPPDDDALSHALGEAVEIWQEAVALLEEATVAAGTWKSYGPKYGWRLDFRRKSGPIAAIYPQRGSLMLGINLLQKEWPAAFELSLSPRTRQVLEQSTALKDGRFLLVPVNDATSLQDLAALVRLKTGTRTKS